MNILYVAHDHKLSGASRSLIEIISRLENKHNIFVLVPTDSGEFYTELKKHRCSIIAEPYYLWVTTKTSLLKWIVKKLRWYIWSRFVNYRTARKVAKIAEEKDIDIIHTNTIVTEMGARIHNITNIKHVWHIREFGDLDFNMYPLPSESFYKAYLNSSADEIVFNSYAVAQHYSYLENKKQVLYNGIGEKYIINDKEKIPHDGINIIIAGRVSKEKGQDQAIAACCLLLEEGIENFHLYIAGTGNIDFKGLDVLETHLTMLGSVSDMVSIRKKMDIELVCSKAEAFGRVTVEAMFAGLAVIGSDTGGTVEIIVDNETGLLYKHNDIKDLKEKIKSLIQNDDLRYRLGKTGREYAVNKFGIDNLINGVSELYERVLHD